MGLPGSNIKKFLIMSQKKVFPIFREMELFYISGNKNTEKILYISGNRTFLYFTKRKPRKNSLYVRRNVQSPKTQNVTYFSKRSYE